MDTKYSINYRFNYVLYGETSVKRLAIATLFKCKWDVRKMYKCMMKFRHFLN